MKLDEGQIAYLNGLLSGLDDLPDGADVRGYHFDYSKWLELRVACLEEENGKLREAVKEQQSELIKIASDGKVCVKTGSTLAVSSKAKIHTTGLPGLRRQVRK